MISSYSPLTGVYLLNESRGVIASDKIRHCRFDLRFHSSARCRILAILVSRPATDDCNCRSTLHGVVEGFRS